MALSMKGHFNDIRLMEGEIGTLLRILYFVIDSEWPICRPVSEEWLEDGNFDEE